MHAARPAVLDDIPRMLALGIKMHAESRYAKYPMNHEKVARLFRELIESPTGIVLITDHGMLFGGVAEYWFSDVSFAGEHVIYVEPEFRGNGEAVALVLGYVAASKRLRVADIHVQNTTGVDIEKTCAFFVKMGFDPVGGNFVMEV